MHIPSLESCFVSTFEELKKNLKFYFFFLTPSVQLVTFFMQMRSPECFGDCELQFSQIEPPFFVFGPVSQGGLLLDFSPLHSNTLSSLVEESGCPLEHPKAATFRARVIAGEWDLVS